MRGFSGFIAPPGGIGRKWVMDWANSRFSPMETNDIGVQGMQDFGVGICPTGYLPPGFTLLPGTEITGHAERGNYRFQEGSIIVYVPAHWVKIGSGLNGLPVNQLSVLKFAAFTSEAVANAAGYFLPRCFRDGGEIKLGCFVDKYECSKNAWGTGFVASSLPNGLPLSTSSAHNPINGLTACLTNANFEAINAAKARDGINGVASTDPQWFCTSRFIYVDLAVLSMAHGQASLSDTFCKWYDPAGIKTYPKGNNNDALRDCDDTSVAYIGDGYLTCGKTGSGLPFEKTTHNGQASGVCDLNGNLWEISLGVTCIASTMAIEGITSAITPVFAKGSHGLSVGDRIMIAGITQTSWTVFNDRIWRVATTPDANSYTVETAPDTSAYAAYNPATDPGTYTKGKFFVAKEAVAMKEFTAGNSLVTDHWGAVGVAQMMDEFQMVFKTDYPNNGLAQRMGSGAKQVLDDAISGPGSVLTALGLPKSSDVVDAIGTNLFGKDYFYQSIRNELCVLSGGYWSSGSYAGVWVSNWSSPRAYSGAGGGFRCACYPV